MLTGEAGALRDIERLAALLYSMLHLNSLINIYIYIYITAAKSTGYHTVQNRRNFKQSVICSPFLG